MNQCVKHSLFAVLGIFSKLTGRAKEDGLILFYHDVHDHAQYTPMGTPLKVFLEHCRVLKSRGYVFCEGIPHEKKNIQICFDDGFRGVWDCQNEILSLGILPTIFVAVDLIGREGYLTLNEIQTLQKKGFKFQSHTWSHRTLTDCQTHDELWHELYDARMKLNGLLGSQVEALCFPRGIFSVKVCQMALEAGYKDLYSSIPGYVSQMILPQVYARNLVQFLSPFELKCILKGAMTLLRGRYRKMHFIDD